jgi:hypothetical protein
MEATDTIPACVAERLAQVERDRERIIASIPHVLLAESVAAQFPGPLNCVACPSAGDVTHYYYVRESMREVIAILREYRKLGLRVVTFRDQPDAGSRTYEIGQHIRLYAALPQHEGAACRFVQVGEKVVPVMEIRCDKAKS